MQIALAGARRITSDENPSGPFASDLVPTASETRTRELRDEYIFGLMCPLEARMDHGIAARACPERTIDRKGLSAPALRTFFRIAALWSLSVEEQMTLTGLSARSTFFKWRKGPTVILPTDTLERISCIVGVCKALQILLPDEKAADEWVKRPNAAPPFNGRSAPDRMMSGQVADLFMVRQYLDAELGGWALRRRLSA